MNHITVNLPTWGRSLARLRDMVNSSLKGLWKLSTLIAIPCFVAVYFGAFWLRFDGELQGLAWQLFLSTVGWMVVVKIGCFAWFEVFRGWNRFFTLHDLTNVVKAAAAAALCFPVVDYLVSPEVSLPRSIVIINWGGTVALIGLLRSLQRLRHEGVAWFSANDNGIPVLIVGADETGESLLRNLRSTQLPYRVMGFMAADEAMVGTHIGGVPVRGLVSETCRVAKRLGLREVLVTSGQLTGKELRSLVQEGRSQELAVRVLPSYQQLIDGHVDLTPRKVSIEDLLQRAPVQLDQVGLHNWLDDKVLMITGSAGSIGSEICRQLLRFQPRRLVCVDRWENGQFFLERDLRRKSDVDLQICIADAADRERMHLLMSHYRPDVIFHAAAYKHVPLMEANPGEAVKNIVSLTQGLADLAVEHGVESFVMVSTDKAVNPTNVMGACKRAAELYVQSLTSADCRFVTVRFGNVLDSAGSVVPIFRQQIADGGPVTVTHPDMVRYFMTIPEASQLVIQAGAMGQGGEIFVLDMGNPVRIVDLAEDMIRLSGLRIGEDIEIEFVGCRPGEKLFEELRADGEQRVRTSHPKIQVAECPAMNRLEILRAVRRLSRLADQPAEFIINELRTTIPEFKHARHDTAPLRRAA